VSSFVRCGVLLTAIIASMHPTPARFLALGDSYTIGEGVAEADRWPVQLAKRLRESGLPVSEPEIVARTGWTTDELDAAITERAPRGPYAIVTLLIGVNNQYRKRSVDDFRTQLRGLIGRATGFAGGAPQRVVLVSIPDWGVTPFNAARDRATVAREIDAFNAAARDEARRANVQWVDITDLTRAAPGDVVGDGLHPSAGMYRQWTDRLAPVASAILRPR
jgi:lysophospholipase L1-like esterase